MTQKMMVLLGADYTMYEIREAIDAVPHDEEVHMVQLVVQQFDISKTTHERVQTPSNIITPQ